MRRERNGKRGERKRRRNGREERERNGRRRSRLATPQDGAGCVGPTLVLRWPLSRRRSGEGSPGTVRCRCRCGMELGRLEYLQALVTEFQATESAEAKEQVLANLANFAYDPRNYEYLRQLQVLDLFLDMLGESSDTLVEFAMGEGSSSRRDSGGDAELWGACPCRGAQESDV
uniref:Uncharacterized protein n=1 Tax=Melopsittacus undulatus TaxID=13146 RepID=A0A8V5HDA4_MELUD